MLSDKALVNGARPQATEPDEAAARAEAGEDEQTETQEDDEDPAATEPGDDLTAEQTTEIVEAQDATVIEADVIPDPGEAATEQPDKTEA